MIGPSVDHESLFCALAADLGHISIQQVQRSKLHLTRTTPGGEPILEEGDEQQQQQQLDEGDLLDPALMVMPEIEEQEEHMQQQHEALSNDEAHDQLMELPFAGEGPLTHRLACIPLGIWCCAELWVAWKPCTFWPATASLL